MLDAARGQNTDENLEFLKLDVENINEIGRKFDIVYSSMTMHYIADFDRVVKKIHRVLRDGGIFLFSQDHPMGTASPGGPAWVTDHGGAKTAASISHYLVPGERAVIWMEQIVTKHHRPVSVVINTLVENGFSISRVIEPAPTEDILAQAPHMYDEIHRPTAIIIGALKVSPFPAASL